MNTLMLLCLAVFFCCLVHALVVGSWRDAVAKAWNLSAAEQGPLFQPMVSLLVPARNAADTITPLLQDLYAQQWPKEKLEVLVVDDASADATASVVRGLMRTWPGLRLLHAEGEGKKAAITQAVAEAQGAWLVMTDADARCGPARVKRIMERLLLQETDLLLLPVETRSAGGFIQRLQAEEQTAMLGAAAGLALQGQPLLANGANMAFSKEAFLAVGGYTGDKWASGDDMFLLRRMRKAGRRVGYLLDPEVLVTVQAEPLPVGFWRQRLRWAGKMRGVGGFGTWGVGAALLLPWCLLAVCLRVIQYPWAVQSLGACLMLLVAAWLLWIWPVLSLCSEVRRFLRAAGGTNGNRALGVSTALAYFAFHVYAPLVALASFFIRPTWKGRPT